MKNRNKPLIIAGIVILAAALVAFLVGGAVAGWDFAAFFTSQAFLWICILVGAYLLAVAVIVVKGIIDNKL